MTWWIKSVLVLLFLTIFEYNNELQNTLHLNNMPKDYSKLSKEQLIELVEKLESKKKYGLVWDEERVTEQVVLNCSENLPVLTEVKEREIHTLDDEPTHILIEGDNYHALSVLNYTHAGKIDLIYIDPPYNTGATDWKYNNKYVDENDTWRHSKWLQMMKNRLVLAKRLLKPDGVIIITIDDNELFNLGVLVKEIFDGWLQYVVTIEHNKRGRRGINFAKTNEFALFITAATEEVIQGEKSETMFGGESRNLRRTGSGSKRHERWRKFFPIYVNETTLEIIEAGDSIPVDENWEYERNGDIVSVFPIDEDGVEKNWHYGLTRTREAIKSKQLYAKKQSYGIQIYYTLRTKESKRLKTVWSKPTLDASTYGSELLNEILGGSANFDYPKSLYAVMDCIRAVCDNRPNAVILDFFAGSGTTGHAVLELNKQDCGNRQFILCTNNENGICEEVTYPRIRNVIQGYDYSGKIRNQLLSIKLNFTNLKRINDFLEEIKSIEEENESTQSFNKIIKEVENNYLIVYGEKLVEEKKDGLGNNLRYFKTSFVRNTENKDQLRIDITRRCSEMLCLKEDVFKLRLETTDWKIFEAKNKFLAVYYDFPNASLDELRNEMNAIEGEKILYCFTADPSGLDKEEFSDWENTRLEPIPQKILDIYKQIFQ